MHILALEDCLELISRSTSLVGSPKGNVLDWIFDTPNYFFLESQSNHLHLRPRQLQSVEMAEVMIFFKRMVWDLV